VKTHLTTIGYDGDHYSLCGSDSKDGVYETRDLDRVDCKRCLRIVNSLAQERSDRKAEAATIMAAVAARRGK
jgi:hypothetical protein